MKTTLALAAAGLFALAGCGDAVESAQGDFALQSRNAFEILPAGSDMVGMVNIQAARQTGFFEHDDAPFSAEHLDGENAARFNEFMRLTGFDPEEDVRRVYMTASDEDGVRNTPAFVVYADFDRSRIDSYLDDNAPEGVERSTYNDVPVYFVHEDEGTFGFGLVNNEMAVAAEQSELYAMIDRVANGTTGLANDTEMMALIERAAHPDGAWFALRELPESSPAENSGFDPTAGLGQATSLLGSGIISFSFEGGDVEMTAYGIPRESANASDIADLLKGGVAVLRTMSEDQQPEMAEMLNDIDIRESSGAVQVHAVLDHSFIQGMAGQHH